jgi:hypothetical protein
MCSSALQRDIEIHHGYEPGLIGRVAELHGRYYAVAWSSGAPFELLMRREICDFIEHYDPARQAPTRSTPSRDRVHFS